MRSAQKSLAEVLSNVSLCLGRKRLRALWDHTSVLRPADLFVGVPDVCMCTSAVRCGVSCEHCISVGEGGEG